MRPKKPETTRSDDLFRARLDQIINLKHELAQLAAKIDWEFIDGEIAPLYSDKGRPRPRHGEPRRIFISGQKRGVFGVIKRELRRRSAIEPVIGHMKAEGHLGRCHLKGRAGDSQRHPLRHRIQLPPYPRLAEGSLAPNLDRDPVPLDRSVSAHSGFLTDDYKYQGSTDGQATKTLEVVFNFMASHPY